MRLLHRVSETNTNYDILEKIGYNINSLYDNILHTIKYENTSPRYLPKIDLPKNLHINNREYDLNSNIYSSLIGSFLKTHNIDVFDSIISRFTPINIIKSVLKKHNTEIIYTFKYKSNLFKIIVFLENKVVLLDLINKAIKAFLFMEIFGFKNQNIKVFYYPTKFKKLDSKNRFIGISSVNSGFTTFKDVPEITIFRKEESDKVLIHELVHLLKLDFALLDNNSIDNIIIKNVNINKENQYINFFEAYTDSIAIIFNSIFNCIITKTHISSYFKLELLHLEDTVINILNHFDMESINDLLKKDNDRMLIQKTSVLSYYILKYGLLLQSSILLTTFYPGIKWTDNQIKELYSLSINSLKKAKLNHNKLNLGSMKMSYNELIY